MAEESTDLASKAFGVVPYLFFDLIARVAPGLVLLYGVDHVNNRYTVPGILAVALPNAKLQESSIAWLAVLIVTGYILGHAISPIVRLMEDRPEILSDTAPGGWLKSLLDKLRAFSRRRPPLNRILRCFLPPLWKNVPEELKNAATGYDYNYLRLNHPGVSSIAMRIRAEYTMYGGFAVALMIVLLFTLMYQLKDVILCGGVTCWYDRATPSAHIEGALLFAITILGIPIMLRRQMNTKVRFAKTVEELKYASEAQRTTLE